MRGVLGEGFEEREYLTEQDSPTDTYHLQDPEITNHLFNLLIFHAEAKRDLHRGYEYRRCLLENFNK